MNNSKLIKAGVRYVLVDRLLHIIDDDGFLRIVDIEKSNNCLRVNISGDEYYFLDLITRSEAYNILIKYQNSLVSITLTHQLLIMIDGEIILKQRVVNIEYSHYELVGDMCLIYFVGQRNYLVILKGKDLISANYFDEYNQDKDDRYYLLRLYDSLNHGRVYHIHNKECEDYLVYLDDEDLMMNDELIGTTFLDCILAGNLKYANQMLKEDIRQEDHNILKTFFADFDYFYPVDDKTFILINKNTLAGIYRFEYISREISNIIEMK